MHYCDLRARALYLVHVECAQYGQIVRHKEASKSDKISVFLLLDSCD